MPSPSEASTSRSSSPASAPDDVSDHAETAAVSSPTTFESLGVIPPLLEALEQVKFTKPTEIQIQAIPHALQGKDIIGVAETGSGKTAAFALPILQMLWDDPKAFFCCVLAPTRELAYQISQQFESLGSSIGVRCAVLVGGIPPMDQRIALSKKPHIIIATPGRLHDHLENTKGFSLRNLKYLVMDEADRLLDMDFGPVIDKILRVIPKEGRRTFLFSATMSTKVEKLQRASLRSPVKVEVSTKYTTVSTLQQHYIFVPFTQKDTYLLALLTTPSLSSLSSIIFTRTVHDAQRLSIVLRLLGLSAIPLHGQLSQSARLGSLNKFKSGGRSILVATDVASRGLDIPLVDLVVNYDVPQHSKDYIHRVGRTARAGRNGRSITIVSQYDVELVQRIEEVTGVKMSLYGDVGREEVAILMERVGEAQREAVKELKDAKAGEGGGGGGGARKRKMGENRRDRMDRDDDSYEAGVGDTGRGGGGGGRKKFKGKR